MKPDWQKVVLDGLEALDGLESPHGLYGLCEAHSVEGRRPSLAHLLVASGKTSVLRQAGFQDLHSRFGSEKLRFRTEDGDGVALQVLDYATTKVRHYGSAYRLDTHHGKVPAPPDWDLESMVPKLPDGTPGTRGILLVAHFASGKELPDLVGRSTSPDFLSRHGIAHFSRGWEDRHGRGFQTAVLLWNSASR
jgi:hypothetical protein